MRISIKNLFKKKEKIDSDIEKRFGGTEGRFQQRENPLHKLSGIKLFFSKVKCLFKKKERVSFNYSADCKFTVPAQKEVVPVVAMHLIISNDNDYDVSVSLFNPVRNLILPNNGLPDGISVFNGFFSDKQAYGFLLNSLLKKTIKINYIRIFTEQGKLSSLGTLYVKNINEMFGRILTIPISIFDKQSAYQFSANIIEMPNANIELCPETSIDLTIRAKDKLDISFHISEIK